MYFVKVSVLRFQLCKIPNVPHIIKMNQTTFFKTRAAVVPY